MEREELYRRIDARVDAMVAAGALEEVRRAEAAGASATARKALGLDVLLRGDMEAMKRRTRNYARRQLTWMRRLEGGAVSWTRVAASAGRAAVRAVLLAPLARRRSLERVVLLVPVGDSVMLVPAANAAPARLRQADLERAALGAVRRCLPPDQHSVDQLRIYDALTPLGGATSPGAGIPRYFKSARFFAPEGRVRHPP